MRWCTPPDIKQCRYVRSVLPAESTKDERKKSLEEGEEHKWICVDRPVSLNNQQENNRLKNSKCRSPDRCIQAIVNADIVSGFRPYPAQPINHIVTKDLSDSQCPNS